MAHGTSLPAGRDENRLLQGDESFRAMFANAAIGFAVTDSEGRFLEANAAYCALTGYSLEVLRAKKVVDVVHPEDSEVNAGLLDSLRAGDLRDCVVENRYVRQDGSTIWVRKSVSAIRGDDGSVRGFAALVEDIGERKRMEDAQRRSQEDAQRRLSEIEAIYDAAPVGLCVIDTDLRFVRVNARFAEIDGFPAAAHIGKTPGELNPSIGPAAEEALRRILDTGEPLLNLEVSGVTASMPGVVRTWIEQWIPLKDGNGRIAGISIAAEEVTDRKQGEEEVGRSRRTFAELVERAPFGIYVVDSSLRIAQMNIGSQNGAFRNVRPVIGRDLAEAMRILWPEPVAANIVAAFRHTLETGEPYYSPRFVNLRHDLETVEAYEWELHRMLLPDGQQGVVCYYFDSTKLREAEESLRRSEARWNAALEHLGEGAIIASEAGKVIYWNPAARRMHGFASAWEGIGPLEGFSQTFQLWTEDGARLLAFDEWPMPRIMRGETVRNVELRLRRPEQGWEKVVSYSGAMVQTAGGERLVYLSVYDRTDQRSAEQALRESEHFYRQMLESIPGMVFTTRPDGYCDYQSRQWVNYTGVPVSEHMGDGWNKLLHPKDRPRAFAAWRAAVEGRAPYDLEYRVRRHDGAYEWFRVIARPIRDAAGRIVRWFGVAMNIEQLKRSEDALRESEERLRLAQTAANIGVWDWDLTSRTVRWTRELEKIFGLELGGASTYEAFSRCVHPEDLAPMEAKRDEAVAQHRGFEFDFRILRPGGELAWVHSRGAAEYDLEGAPIRAFGVAIDITGRRQAEERLRQAQKLESLGILAGGVAHDFNNLLVGVIGNASLAQDILPADHPAVDLLQGILNSGEQAAHLTRQMLAYSGRGRFVIEPLNLSGVIPDIVSLLRSSISKKISLQLDLDEHLPSIEADRGQIQQIVMNLAINAAEAIGSQDGLISVRTGILAVDETFRRLNPEAADLHNREYVFVAVHDTGCGMDRATRAKIFDPFFSTKFTGRGLGLAAVAGIVRGHGGAILVDTRPGEGSTFKVLFPSVQAAARQLPATPLTTALRGSGVVLVVDDEAVVRETAKSALEVFGYQVVPAEDGLAAIEAFKRYPGEIALVVLDLSMPNMGGEETLPELRRIRPDVKVVVSSGYTEAETMKLFAGHRNVGFIQKPYTGRQLAEAAKRALV